METENIVEFVPLKDHADYEILSTFPFTIRRKDNHREVKCKDNYRGYFQVYLNGKHYYHHVLIAKQFIPNPNNLPFVDHINHDRSDNNIKNLRWVTASANCKNKSSHCKVKYEFVDSISDDAIVVDNYNGHELEDYYYYDNLFYFYNGIQYRKLHVIESKLGGKYVNMTDVNHNKVSVYYSTFKKLHDLD